MSRQRRLNQVERIKKELSEQRPKKSVVRRIIEILLGLMTVAGFYISIIPRPTVNPEGPVDTNQPFSIPITIVNSSIVPLKNVSAALAVGEIATEPRKLDPNLNPDYEHAAQLTKTDWKWHALSVDERVTINLAELFGLGPGARLGGADVALRIDYEPWFVPIRRSKMFRFVARKQIDGSMRLYSAPLK